MIKISYVEIIDDNLVEKDSITSKDIIEGYYPNGVLRLRKNAIYDFVEKNRSRAPERENGCQEYIVRFSKNYLEDLLILDLFKGYWDMRSTIFLYPNPFGREDKLRGGEVGYPLSFHIGDKYSFPPRDMRLRGCGFKVFIDAYSHEPHIWHYLLVKPFVDKMKAMIWSYQIDVLIFPDLSAYKRCKDIIEGCIQQIIVFDKERVDGEVVGSKINQELTTFVDDGLPHNTLVIDDILCKGGTFKAIPKIDGWKYYGLVAYNEMHITEVEGFEKIEWLDTFWGED